MPEVTDARRRRLTRSPRPSSILAVLALVGMNASFMHTLVIPIQAQLPELLSANRDDTSWVVTVTLLTSAVATPISGRLGDLIGKRRVLIVLLGVLLVGSVIAAVSNSLAGVILGRALQGVAFGVVPLGISILRDVFPPARLGSAVALMSATLGIGGSLGLPLAAVIAENFEWHIIFWLSAALAVISAVLVFAIVPESVLRSAGRFDVVGAVGLGLGLVGVLLAATKGATWGWLSPLTLGTGIGGLLVLVAWTFYELRHDAPLVDLRVAVRPAVLFTNLAAIGTGFALFVFSVAVPQLLEAPVANKGFGLTILLASLVLLPNGVMMLIGSPIVGRIERRTGGRMLLASGLFVIALSFVIMLFATQVGHIVAASVLLGIGLALSYAVLPTLIMGAVPATETAAANGLNALMRSLGTTIAAATIGAVLAASTAAVEGATPSLEGFRIAFAVGGAVALLSVVPALLLPRRRTPYDKHPSLPDAR